MLATIKLLPRTTGAISSLQLKRDRSKTEGGQGEIWKHRMAAAAGELSSRLTDSRLSAPDPSTIASSSRFHLLLGVPDNCVLLASMAIRLCVLQDAPLIPVQPSLVRALHRIWVSTGLSFPVCTLSRT